MIRGADAEAVRRAIDTHDPLPGTAGFAGILDNRLVRDVLGRQPLFGTPDDWGFAPDDVTGEATPVPAGHIRDDDGTDHRVWSLPDPPVADEYAAAIGAVRRAVDDSLSGLGDGDGDLAVAFSGGLDSALVAAGLPDAPLYVIGFEGSHDIAAARAAAAAMDRGEGLTVIELDHETLQEAVPRVADAIGRTNPMDVSIALPLLLVAERVREDGYDRLALGQGADELFGGYSKVVDPGSDHRVAADTVRGAVSETIESLPGQLERDVCGLQAVGVDPVTPFLQDRVVDAALRLPGELLASDDERKIALRQFARQEGVVPDEVAATDKKAVQYGSYVSRELDRLARQAGYKRRMDDHVGQYIRSLCE